MASSLYGLLGRYTVVQRSMPSVYRLPAPDPRHFLTERRAEVDGCWMQRQALRSRPEFELVAVTVATMAVVSIQRNVHGEAWPLTRRTARQGAASVPLVAPTTVRFKAEKLEYLLDRNFGTQLVEVNPGHDGSSFGASAME